ncbi:hypothetical protein [Nitrosopumilus maritimus]|uniref:Uncharacterized protein n=1 Tax=Nitrosopumilus maritimus (strain SCM1) TaxID=436308 RepID=A9A4F9_NITMS|nr:hypothetical protein [Nitrosopumilus maritimus]ABX12648.1 hypothetical protein Nmar_0752 [Nitrosopumilus maritimus SCM1]
MAEKVWMGAIFLKDEGGYEIVLKSLEHYRKRLRTIAQSPELKDSAAMFASVLNQQAMKTVPKIDEVVEKIKTSINDIQAMQNLSNEISFFEKALMCYESDIDKAQNTGHEYFVNLVGDLAAAKNDIEIIKTALKKIKEFSE